MFRSFPIFLLALTSFLVSCDGLFTSGSKLFKSDHEAFFNRFRELEGKKFQGRQVFIADGMEDWSEKELVIFIRKFTPDLILIPFTVSEDDSRTWHIYMEKDKLRFRHEHLREDGTQDSISMYGGYTGIGSDAYIQIFPADDYTCQMLAVICDNEWTLFFSNDLSTFSYILRKSGVLILRINFDLTSPL